MLDLFQHLIPFVLRPRNKPDLERISPGFGVTELHFWDSHGYYMPPAYSVWEEFGDDSLPTDTVVVRLLGADRYGIEKKTRKHWTEIVDPQDGTINQTSELIKERLPRKFDVYANFNNRLEGSAPLSIQKLLATIARWS